MKKKKNVGVSAVLVFLFLCFMVLICRDNSWAQNKKLFVEDELLIQFRIDTPKNKADDALNAHGATVADEIQQLRVKRIKVPAHVIDKVKEALSHNPHVDFVENNFLAEASIIPNDSYYSSQWHHPKIKAPYGWDLSTGSNSVAIAIIDSGVDPAHPDLSGKLIPGYNFVSNNTDTHDVQGHGTSVAGSSAAISNNFAGIAGVAWENPVMPLVVLSSDNYASYYNIARAITYAADSGVRVMNISIAGSSSSSTLQNAADYAWNKDSLIFAAAANYNTSTLYYPAACNHVIAVSATDSSDNKASFSNYGDWVDIAAPGVSIYTTANGGGYRSVSGTSFSSPIAAGLGALIMSVNPNLTNAEVEELIKQNADDLGAFGFDPYFGFGRINVERTLVAASSIIIDDPDTTSPTVSITSPSPGTTYTTAQTVTIYASASDNLGVSRVEFYDASTLKGTDTTNAYTYSWTFTGADNGAHNWIAKAYDAAGNVTSSSAVSLTVNIDITPPSIPTGLSATPSSCSQVNLSWNASTDTGGSGLKGYNVYRNGSYLKQVTTTSTSDAGVNASTPYSYTVAAVDNAGNQSAQSTPASATTPACPDTTAPTVSISSPSDGSTFSERRVKIVVSASDNIGVRKIEIYIDGSLIAATNASSFQYYWSTRKASSGAHMITAKAYDATGNTGVHTITVYKK